MTTTVPWAAVTAQLQRQDMTQATLARITGLSPSYINDMIRGRRAPTERAVRLIAAVLQVAPGDIRPADEEVAA
ncbi:helix-turn-helix domain-containing protein [Corynebacterium sphenisci]|uniref:helix-turn-helix domain-containing protein n=1 Tax=Corynebacterium sphenisci TaxID=191493 RepID=UPI0034A024D5